MKKTRGFDESLRAIALRKFRAGQVRFTGQSALHEPPRSVYFAGCAAIARDLAGDGYRYSKSKQLLTRNASPLKFEIRFQSSHSNVAGEYVALWIYTGAYSSELEQWHVANQPLGGIDYFAGGQIGNLLPDKSWYEWNLADVTTRDVEIADAIKTLRNIALPMFQLFEKPQRAADALLTADVPGLEMPHVIDFALCYGSRRHAEVCIDRFLNRWPELHAKYRHFLANSHPLTRDDILKGGYAAELADVTLRFNLHPRASEP